MADISFNTIPALLTPGAYIEIDGSKAYLGLPVPRRRVVIIGQRVATGTADINTLYRVDSVDQGKALAGAGSMLAAMIASYKLNDPSSELWMVAINDLVTGAKASYTFTLSGSPNNNGTIPLRIAGRSYPVPVTAGETATDMATAVAAAINADLDAPFTATSALGVVTITVNHKGTLGNSLEIYVGYTQPAGMTSLGAIATAGTGVADVSTALAAIGDQPFATIVHAYTDDTSLSAIEAWLTTRFDGLHMMDGIAITAQSDTLGNLETLGLSRNSPFTVIGGMPRLPNPPWELAAATAAQVHASANGDPAQPFTGLVVKGILAPDPGYRQIRQEREYLLEDGISTYTIDDSGNVCIERMVTTYTLNAEGFADPTWRDVNTLLTLAYLRWSRRYMISTTFPRYKLGNDGTNYDPGQKIATPKSIKAAIIGQYKTWIGAGLIEDKLEDYKAALVVTRDPNDVNRVNTIDSPDLINQFLVFASQIQFKL